MSLPRYLSSFFIGFAIGAGTALLLTPVSGRRMQRKVADISDRVIDKVDDLKVAARRMAS